MGGIVYYDDAFDMGDAPVVSFHMSGTVYDDAFNKSDAQLVCSHVVSGDGRRAKTALQLGLTTEGRMLAAVAQLAGMMPAG